MSLYEKYRPTSMKEIMGNEDTVQTLSNLLQDEQKRPHVFLLYGPPGCGKNTLAYIIRDTLGCKGMDFREYHCNVFGGIDTSRQIANECRFMPLEGPCKIYLMDEAHQLTKPAMDGLLDITEFTPKHVYFIFCTTNEKKLDPALRSRCTEFQVKPLTDRQMMLLLIRVAKAEGDNVTKEICDQIITDSVGHPRDALTILEKVLNTEPERRMDIAKQAAEQVNQSIELCRALIQGAGWPKVANILTGLQKEDSEKIRQAVMGYCRAVLLKNWDQRTAAVMFEFREPFWNNGFNGVVQACSMLMGE